MKPESKTTAKNRAGEKGAALVTMLLVSILMLGAGGALIMTTMMSSTNAIGSTPEMQAYYVAESGMQSALNVLRGNAKPTLVNADRISFRTAIIPSISNGGNTGSPRLAGWLPYNNPADASSLVPITVGSVTGGYRLTVENMDPNSHIVEFTTSAIIDGSDSATPYQKTFGTVGGTDEVTIRYSGQGSTNLSPDPNDFPLTLDSALGSFVIERPLSSTADDVVIAKTGFEMTITQSLPWAATTILEGTFEGEVDAAATTVKVTFDKASVRADGTTYALNLAGGTQVLDLSYSSSPSTTSVPARVTSPDPKRLLLKSYGFGPQGAEKRLELMINKANFEFEMPGGTTLRGPDDCSSPLVLDTGSSGTKIYSGVDAAGVEPQRPAFAVMPCDQAAAEAGIKKPDTVVDPEVGLLGDDDTDPGTVETPSFLDTADRARAYLNALQAKAQSLGRYFNPGTGETTISDSVNASQFTFVDGDCTLHDGAGFLVVTGKLTMRGDTNFKGVILVLGEGVVERDGGGNGEIYGGITIASFGRASGDFTAPTFETNGGGNSTIQYDSSALKSALGSGQNVSGIREF